ncbi:MAG: T9SS type A sorting domain-containing protein [Hymenobacteraceae bacterium]|nr:T9SS type A sorting domain-containing protein [Hymenobacteraceae bacterium]
MQTLARDASGRLLVAGQFDRIGSALTGRVTRLLASGAPDPTFNPGGAGANGGVRQLVVLPSGKLLIAGTFTRYNGTRVGRLARLNADGTLDTGFNAGGTGADHPVTALTVDAAGLIYVGGSFAAFNGQTAYGLVRLTGAGSVDPSFAVGQGFLYIFGGIPSPYRYNLTRLVLDAQDRLVVGGNFLQYQGNAIENLIRLLPTGVRDPSFNADGGGPEGVVYDLAVLANGDLLVAGAFTRYKGAAAARVIRVTTTGALDPSFTNSSTLRRPAQAIAPLPSGQLLIAAGRTVVRLNASGAIDPAFAAVTLSANGLGRKFLLDPTGEVWLGGSFDQVNQVAAGSLLRLLPTGAPDPAATRPIFGQRSLVNSLLPLPGDSLLVLGDFASQPGGPAGPLLRLAPNGRPDPSFQTDPLLSFTSAAVGPTGQLFVYNFQLIFCLTRTGAVDASFRSGNGAAIGGYIETIVLLDDGKVLVGGNFRSYNGTACDGLIRLLPTGAADPTFRPVAAPGQSVYAITVRADGHLALLTQSDSASTPSGLIGLLPDGAPDLAFGGGNPTNGFGSQTRLIALPDTSLLVVGALFRDGSAAFAGPLTHLRPTGLFNSRFQADLSFTANDEISAVAVQPDGGILFVTAPPYSPLVRRLKPDGSLDPTFEPIEVGTGYQNESVTHIVVQSGQRVVLGGHFADVAGTPFPGLARLAGVPLGLPAAPLASRAAVMVFPNPAHDSFTIRRPRESPATAQLFDPLGRLAGTWPLARREETVRVGPLPAGVYVHRTRSADGTSVMHRVVLE